MAIQTENTGIRFQAMSNRGTWVILAMMGVGVAASAFAWLFVWRQSQRLIHLWGGEVAATIRKSSHVELLSLSRVPVGETGSMRIDAVEYWIEARRDVSHRPGLIHAQAALIADASFDWRQSPGAAQWEFALRFSNSDAIATLAFDLNSRQVICVEQRKSASLTARINDGLRTFFREITPTPP
jgi:hypothetical protein